MTASIRGLYESLLTGLVGAQLSDLAHSYVASDSPLRNAEAADRIALHLAQIIERSIESLSEPDRAAAGVSLARQLIETIAARLEDSDLLDERPIEPPRVLRAINGLRPDGTPDVIDPPLTPLLDTTLLTNSPGEPRVLHEIQAEVASADRIDVVMAFIRRSGMFPLRDNLRRHVESGRKLRVLTTTYTGSTEAAALELLQSIGADVRVSYDNSSTRLHAKAWLFHRESGLSTAYVGSSNLTHSAQVTGLEWNVRVSGARNRAVVDKVAAVFESYWQQPDFAPYDADRFAKATARNSGSDPLFLLSPIEIQLYPFQDHLLEQIKLARQQGHHRNLLVAATGTGKTVMAAVDYARLRDKLPRARLLFVAHREEILDQSRRTFAHALRDASFGELWVGGRRPTEFEHVFASIQSLNAAGLDSLDPAHFDVVIIDEFHHAAAASYQRLLDHVQPVELLGLTATPERSDELSLLHWFDGRIAAELRLWDAIEQQRLAPFAYYGIADELDLREVPFKRGTGYDVEAVTKLITANDVWARRVVKQFHEHVDNSATVKALGFCVSVDHARYMARVFTDNGIASVAVWANTPEQERQQALRDLAAGKVRVVFSVDLFNEGVDVPAVDTLLMLRPTESPVLFLQQLGRGLRKSEGKTVCTVLDFVGRHRAEFRYDRRFQALLGGSRSSVAKQVESNFPFLPAGCHMELDRIASERVLQSIRNAVPKTFNTRAEELRKLEAEQPGITLAQFLELSSLDLEDVYASGRSWSDLRQHAGIRGHKSGPEEAKLRKACGRLLHVDDAERIDMWQRWLREDRAPDASEMSERERRLLRMLVAQVVQSAASKSTTLYDATELLWAHPQVRFELVELLDVLRNRIQHAAAPLSAVPDAPLFVSARYTRIEIQAGMGDGDALMPPTWREGVKYVEEAKADVFVFTLDKTGGQFSPSTRYRDYAISPQLIHWESQSMTRANSPTGQRYQHHEKQGRHVLLFGRLSNDDRAFYFVGPATYVSHEKEAPMAITWRLQHPLPGDLFQRFAAAVA